MAFWVVVFLYSAQRLRFAILKVVRASQSGMLRMGKSLEEEGGKLQAEQIYNAFSFHFSFLLRFLGSYRETHHHILRETISLAKSQLVAPGRGARYNRPGADDR